MAAIYDEELPVTAINCGSFCWVTRKLRKLPLTLAIEIYPEECWIKPAFPLSLLMHGLLILWTELTFVREKNSLFSHHVVSRINGYASDLILKGDGARKNVGKQNGEQVI